jgi:methionyl-tRNA formyltransferase
MATSWRIVFFGTPVFAVPTLTRLFEGSDEVVAVVTQPDRRRGRGQRVFPSPVKDLALKHGGFLLQPDHAKDALFQSQLKELHPDLFVVVAYGQILPGPLLRVPANGAINVHASLLPTYRGAAPIAWAILKGEKVTGITTMRMDAGMDTGDILLQAEVTIGARETYESLHDRLADLGARLLLETVTGLKAGAIRPAAQDHAKASYAPSLKKENGWIDWDRQAEEIDRQIRAFTPWPGAFTRWERRLLKICGGRVREGVSEGKGGLVTWVGSDFVQVATGKDFFLIEEVQLEGGKRMPVREFLLGHPVSVGTTFG